MNERGLPGSCMVGYDEKSNSVYPMIFGVSCALFALRRLWGDEVEDEKRFEITEQMLKGSANLMGWLTWRVESEKLKSEKYELLRKLKNKDRQIEELTRRRIEDAKANEKVVSIFAAHEQGWFVERKKLRQQIGALLNEVRAVNKKRDEKESTMNGQLQEKDKLLDEEKRMGKELEESLKKAETTNEELREKLKRDAQEHSKEIWKHKSAFIELVSTQRQLEAEMGRAVRQVEAAKQELDAVLEQKEQYVLMTQKLSLELIKTRKDLEQKDKILSAMLRKSKLDTAEKQMLLKEVKLSKSKRQQAEQETEKWKTATESRQERYSLRSMLSRHHKPKQAGRGVSNTDMPSLTRSQPSDLLEYEQPDYRKEQEVVSPLSQHCFMEGSEELIFAADIRQLEGWVQCEAEKYITAIEQRHQLEVNAFAEQLRLKDEKLEAFRWRSLSMELESKRLNSHVEGLDNDLSQLRQENLKLESSLLDREAELHSLKERLEAQLSLPNSQMADSNLPSHSLAIAEETWSNVKIINRKPGGKEKEQDQENSSIKNQSKGIVLTVQSPEKEFEDSKDVELNLIPIGEEQARNDDVQIAVSSSSSSSWKMDLHALGVFYKIKRLKQQLLMFERLTGKQECSEITECDDKRKSGIKGFDSLMSLINKQVNRYQSLQGKADDLCKRMHENDLDTSRGGPIVAKSKEETKKLEHFLEETFQLQRYIVATGQKLMEIQSKIACGFVGAPDDELDERAASFDMKRFADCLRTLFREVQRGLEVRISRIIGDLEGTLARDGMIHRRT